jgi:hypothetical protein
LVLQ